MSVDKISLISIVTFVLLPLVALGSSTYLPVFFNQQIDPASIEKTFGMTSRELVRHIRSRGLNVYLIKTQNLNPESAPDLAPEQVQKRWAPAFIQDKIFGKYFSSLDPRNPFSQPTILVTDLNDKWTLLHEYMHFLFERSRRELKQEDSNVFEAQQNAREDYLDLSGKLKKSREPEIDQIELVIKAFSQFVAAELKLAEHVTLEEMAIEKPFQFFLSKVG